MIGLLLLLLLFGVIGFVIYTMLFGSLSIGSIASGTFGVVTGGIFQYVSDLSVYMYKGVVEPFTAATWGYTVLDIAVVALIVVMMFNLIATLTDPYAKPTAVR